MPGLGAGVVCHGAREDTDRVSGVGVAVRVAHEAAVFAEERGVKRHSVG